jgi:hypothetical protein
MHACARTLPVASAYECEARMQAIHGMQGFWKSKSLRLNFFTESNKPLALSQPSAYNTFIQ